MRELVVPGAPEHFDYLGPDDVRRRIQSAWDGPGGGAAIQPFAYRAIHELAVKSKAVIAAFYDRAPRFSYWMGCSTGGRQGLMAAQRYPEDFDGIVAGAPANNQTQLCAWRIAVEAKILQAPASVVPREKLALVNRAVLAACDALDGVTDGLLSDPAFQ